MKLFKRLDKFMDWITSDRKEIVYRVLVLLTLLGLTIMYLSISGRDDIPLVLIIVFFVGFFIFLISLVLLVNLILYHKHQERMDELYEEHWERMNKML